MISTNDSGLILKQNSHVKQDEKRTNNIMH